MKSHKLYPDWPLALGIVVVALIAIMVGIMNAREHRWTTLAATTSLFLVIEATLLRTLMTNRWVRRLWER